MKTIKLFEAFAGIGSQYKALKNIAKSKDWIIKPVGIIEWFIPAIIAYQAIHYNNLCNKVKPQELIRNNITLSNDSKKAISDDQILKLNNSIEAFWINQSIINSNNYFDIQKTSGGGDWRWYWYLHIFISLSRYFKSR